MRKTHFLALAAAGALFLAGCGSRSDDLASQVAGAPQTAPGQPTQTQPAQQHAEGGSSWFLPAVIGYMLGRTTAPQAAPVQQAAPSYTPPRPAVSKPSWFERMRSKPAAVPAPAPVKPSPPPTAPPKFSTSPNTYTVPKPTAAPKPSSSGPSSYKAPSYSFKPSSPSRSFSSPSRR